MKVVKDPAADAAVPEEGSLKKEAKKTPEASEQLAAEP